MRILALKFHDNISTNMDYENISAEALAALGALSAKKTGGALSPALGAQNNLKTAAGLRHAPSTRMRLSRPPPVSPGALPRPCPPSSITLQQV